MTRARAQRRLLVGAACAAALAAPALLWKACVFESEVWQREQPLIDPITVTGVQGGTVTLADGRQLRPAGVRRADGVSSDDFDRSLRVVCAQGVVVVRDLGDSSAMLVAEPRFYNPCGTRGHNGDSSERWAGSYVQCPVSELLITTGYAAPDLDQTTLTARDRWRLEGLSHLSTLPDAPAPIAGDLTAFRYAATERFFIDYDARLEALWKPAP